MERIEKSIVLFIYGIILSVGIVLLFSSIFIAQLDYPSFVKFTGDTLGRDDLQDIIRSAISERQFHNLALSLKVFCFFYFFAVLPVFYSYRKSIVSEIAQFSRWFLERIAHHAEQLKGETKLFKVVLGFVFLVFLGKNLTYLFTWPFQYDELWTYLNFIDQPILVTLSAPHNNHQLFTLFAWFFKFIPFEPLHSIRLILSLFAFASGLTFYSFSRKLFNNWVSIWLSTFLLFSIPVSLYSVYARSYQLIIFFSIVVTWMSYSIDSSSNNKWHCWILCIASILGLYSQPAFIFVLIGIFLPLILKQLYTKRFVTLRNIVLTGVGVLLGAGVLYSPVLLSSNFSWLVSTGSTTLEDSTLLVNWMGQATYFFSGITPQAYWLYLSVCALATLGIFFVEKDKKFLVVLIATNLLLPLVVIACLKIKIPIRTNAYLIVYIALLIGLALNSTLCSLNLNFKILALTGLTLVIPLSSYVSHFNDHMQWSYGLDQFGKSVSERLLQEDVSNIYNYSVYHKPILSYYFRTAGKELEQLLPIEQSVSHGVFDSEEKYDAVLWRPKDSFTKPDLRAYKKVLEFENCELYILK